MNKLSIYTLTSLRLIYGKVFNVQQLRMPDYEQNPDTVSKIIYDKLMEDKPCMIARFGSTELTTVVNYLGIKNPDKNIIHYVKGESLPWWWNQNMLNQMQQWSGFFPPTQGKIEQFCELMLEDMKEVDVLGSWLEYENYFEKELKDVSKVKFIYLEPFWSNNPWTKALAGKKVLVIHPFINSITNQYKKRQLIFPNGLLPDFELITIQAVQSVAGEKTPYSDWFEALNFMKSEIDKVDFDICLVGAGAYGFPLAAYVKKIGKKAVHLGGALQLLFGIMGSRWQQGNYIKEVKETCPDFYNNFWVFPSNDEIPSNANSVENACYWK